MLCVRLVPQWLRPISLALLVALSACGGSPQPDSTDRPTVTPRPILNPTNLPTTTPPAPIAPVTPTVTPDIRLVATFAPDVDPLTDEKVDDPSLLDRRPLEIVIANSNERGVRPQSGASYADWVFEHETEAPGITRWGAIFYSREPSRVGSDRSCRIIDGELPAIFKSLLACSGMSGGTREYYIKPTEFYKEGRAYSPDFGNGAPMFFRTDTAPLPHNMFVNPQAVWDDATQKGINARPDLSGLVFATTPITPGRPAGDVQLAYHAAQIEWKYDANVNTCSTRGGCYLRWSDGVAHTDALNNQQLSAANVIVVYVNYVEDKRYLEEDYGAVKLFGFQIQLWGDPGGRVQIFRDGQVFDGSWNRPLRDSMLQFRDASGQPIPLKPGNTWVQLVRLDAQVQTTP